MIMDSGKGFTLIELLVVISIISLLSSVTLSTVNEMREKARDAVRSSDIGTLEKALALYQNDHAGNLPNPVALGCPVGVLSYCLGVTNGTTCGTGWTSLGCDALNGAIAPYITKLPSDPKPNGTNISSAYLYYPQYDTSPYTALIWGLEKAIDTDADCKGGRVGGTNPGYPGPLYCFKILQ
jgi:prepilin-type N-terminal cleavage/methylation domain-containing protein